jgi:hypothetical protein
MNDPSSSMRRYMPLMVAALLLLMIVLVVVQLHLWPARGRLSLLAGGPAGSDAATSSARFTPQTDATLAQSGMLALPPPGPGRSGLIAFAGRQVVLPRGQWMTVMLSRSGAPALLQSTLLARIEGGHLTGLLLLLGPDPLSHASGPLAAPEACFDMKAIAVESVPEPSGSNPTTHECWNLSVSHILDADAASRLREPLKSAVDRLRSEVAALPKSLLEATFFRSDSTGWLAATFQLPEQHAGSASDYRHLEAWMRKYATTFHRGYGGQISADDLAAALATSP